MRQFNAFLKKEWMESVRTGKLLIFLIVFGIFGIMNPAIAKLTPTLYEMMGDSLAEQGIIIQDMTVDAMTSWGQYYKNISMALIVLVILLSGILTNEYQKGTLINMLTKGLARWKVVMSKGTAAILLWTISYWLCFGITYGYTAFYWDNSIAKHIGYAAGCIYLFGIWLISLLMLGSALFQNNFAVLLTVGGAVAAMYLVSMVPKLTEYLPTQLMSAGTLLSGAMNTNDFTASLVITISLICVNFIIAVVVFNRKRV